MEYGQSELAVIVMVELTIGSLLVITAIGPSGSETITVTKVLAVLSQPSVTSKITT